MSTSSEGTHEISLYKGAFGMFMYPTLLTKFIVSVVVTSFVVVLTTSRVEEIVVCLVVVGEFFSVALEVTKSLLLFKGFFSVVGANSTSDDPVSSCSITYISFLAIQQKSNSIVLNYYKNLKNKKS